MPVRTSRTANSSYGIFRPRRTSAIKPQSSYRYRVTIYLQEFGSLNRHTIRLLWPVCLRLLDTSAQTHCSYDNRTRRIARLFPSLRGKFAPYPMLSSRHVLLSLPRDVIVLFFRHLTLKEILRMTEVCVICIVEGTI